MALTYIYCSLTKSKNIYIEFKALNENVKYEYKDGSCSKRKSYFCISPHFHITKHFFLKILLTQQFILKFKNKNVNLIS